jgi:hypothetical protein
LFFNGEIIEFFIIILEERINMAKLVPTVKTTYKEEQLVTGFINGWIKQFGEIPKKESIAVIYAQNAIETGLSIAMWNNNIGNIKYIPSSNMDNDNVDYMMLNGVWEILNGKRVVFQPPDRQTWFLSFPTLEDGVAHHFNFLKNNRYKKAWGSIEAGNPAQFASILKSLGYYTAPETDYIKAMNLYFNIFMKGNKYETVLGIKVAPWKRITGMFGKLFG